MKKLWGASTPQSPALTLIIFLKFKQIKSKSKSRLSNIEK